MMNEKFDGNAFMSAVRNLAGERAPIAPDLPTLRWLLSMEGEVFVKNAYQAVLGREADKSGIAGYSERAGSFSGRILVLLALLGSPERAGSNARFWKFFNALRKLRRVMAKPLSGNG